MSDEQSKILKQLTAKKTPVAQQNTNTATPAKKAEKSQLFKKLKAALPSNKTMLDCALFAGFCYIVYEYGTDIAKGIEEIVPTEQGMLEMMQQQQS
jgi:hypothetical protein